MNCGFSLDVDMGGEEFDSWSTTITTATQPLQCCECNGEILAGDQYESTEAEIGDESLNYAVCLDCAEIAAAFMDERLYGALWGSIEHELDENPSALTTACFAKLKRASAKKMLQDFWISEVLG